MNYFDTAAGQNAMENISRQLTRIAYSLETLAAAWGKEPDMAYGTEAEAIFRHLEEQA